jgi:VWFA-related protein
MPAKDPGVSFRRLRLVFPILWCLGTLALRSAQTPPVPERQTAQDSGTAPALRVNARLVEVNVIVNDKHGNPVTGLSQKDFSILDNGKGQEISVFTADTNRPLAGAPIPLPPDTYTNRPEEQTNIPASVTVILLDALNTEAAQQTLARSQVIHVLREIQPQEYVALYWLGDSLRVLHDFTTDASSLGQVLAEYGSKSSRQLENSELADPSLTSPNPSTPSASERQGFRMAFDQRVANQSTGDRVRATTAALIAIGNHLGTRKGRKNLVWVSSSFPITLGYDKFDLNWMNDTGANFSADVRRAARALADADIAVYPVDARGLLGAAITANDDDMDAHIGDPSDTDAHLPTRGAPETFDTMRILAERTGGKAFYGTNDISGAIRKAMSDARATYTLGYYPANGKWDGAFHELKVRVAVAGAEVHARSGYFAIPDAPVAAPKDDHALISELAASQLPATGIGLHARLQILHLSALEIRVEVQVDVHEIQMRQKEGRWTGTVQSVFLQLDNHGRIVRVDDRTFHPDFDARAYKQALIRGISDAREVRVLPNAAQLCVVVRDVATASTGSIYLPLTQNSASSSKAGRSKSQ